MLHQSGYWKLLSTSEHRTKISKRDSSLKSCHDCILTSRKTGAGFVMSYVPCFACFAGFEGCSWGFVWLGDCFGFSESRRIDGSVSTFTRAWFLFISSSLFYHLSLKKTFAMFFTSSFHEQLRKKEYSESLPLRASMESSRKWRR